MHHLSPDDPIIKAITRANVRMKRQMAVGMATAAGLLAILFVEGRI